MNNQIILGFGNKARQGKDTAATGIEEWFGEGVLRVGFADALRIEVSDAIKKAGSVENLLAFGFINEEGQHIDIPSWATPTPNAPIEPMCPYGKHSTILQWWGTDYRRAQNPNYWVDKFKEKVINFNGIVVSGDVRFTNEVLAITELGGFSVNVRRLNEDGTQYFDKSRPAGHQSEIELDKWNWDYRIVAKSGQVPLIKAQAVEILKDVMRVKKWII